MAERDPRCTCRTEIGDAPCPTHDGELDANAPAHVKEWRAFLKTVEIRGPIPMRFRVHRGVDGIWVLESKMLVPDRNSSHPCEACERIFGNAWITFYNELPRENDPTPRELVIRQRVLGMFQHEALEAIFIAGARAFDPHEARWYCNLVADWRYNR